MTCNRDQEKIKAYKRAEYKSEAPFIHNGDFVRRDAALYDPRRDDPLHHADLTALLMGDPPIGLSVNQLTFDEEERVVELSRSLHHPWRLPVRIVQDMPSQGGAATVVAGPAPAHLRDERN